MNLKLAKVIKPIDITIFTMAVIPSYTRKKTLMLPKNMIKVPNPSVPNHKGLLRLITFVLDYSYYLLFCPFRITEVQSVGNQVGNVRFLIKTFTPQKVACAISAVLSLFYTTEEVRRGIPTNQHVHNPASYFDLGLALTKFLIRWTTITCFWRKEKDFLQIISYISKYPNDLTSTSSHVGAHSPWFVSVFTKKSVIFGILFINTIIIVLNAVTALVFDDKIGVVRSASETVCSTLDRTKYVLHIQNPSGTGCSITSCTDYVLILLGMIGYIQRSSLTCITDVLILSNVATIWMASYCFAKRLRTKADLETDQLDWNTVYQDYNALKDISDMANEIIGQNVFASFLEALLYYSTAFQQTFVRNGANFMWIVEVNLIYFLIGTSLNLVLAADISQQVTKN